VQYIADASQKFTCPVVNGVDPAVTVAVSVTTLPDDTVKTGPLPEVTASVVAVAVLACAVARFEVPQTTKARRPHKAIDLQPPHVFPEIATNWMARLDKWADRRIRNMNT
jgi:hypothetical protein